ncbi:hypothetical protein RHGRI_029667 [Rhododendron griersonianum]|uniref:Uncharacterized protein n=1 Tax=Rhododendron griersonianum TaxID=479676 RepID=A0AAV6ING3_9ERIC|nr:hypothetical protein RHGRI_029667 [Rhododendron griersonianum]
MGGHVTGTYTDTRSLARLLHQFGAFACFDFAAWWANFSWICFVEIDMRSGEKDGYDAIFLSPHKFLRGPGSPGIPSNEQFSLSAQVFSFINLWRWEFDIHWCQFSYSSYVLHAFSYGMTLVFIGKDDIKTYFAREIQLMQELSQDKDSLEAHWLGRFRRVLVEMEL